MFLPYRKPRARRGGAALCLCRALSRVPLSSLQMPRGPRLRPKGRLGLAQVRLRIGVRWSPGRLAPRVARAAAARRTEGTARPGAGKAAPPENPRAAGQGKGPPGAEGREEPGLSERERSRRRGDGAGRWALGGGGGSSGAGSCGSRGAAGRTPCSVPPRNRTGASPGRPPQGSGGLGG